MTVTQATAQQQPSPRRIHRTAVVCVALLVAGGHRTTSAADPAVPAVRLDSIGYLPEANKRATVAAEGIESFAVRDAVTGAEVFRGRAELIIGQADGRGAGFVVDFSALRQPGTYQLVIPGGETSATFVVADDVYNWPFYCVMRGMYLWRCGTAVAGDFAGHTFQHAACHLDDAYLDHAGGSGGRAQRRRRRLARRGRLQQVHRQRRVHRGHDARRLGAFS